MISPVYFAVDRESCKTFGLFQLLRCGWPETFAAGTACPPESLGLCKQWENTKRSVVFRSGEFQVYLLVCYAISLENRYPA